MSTATTLLKKHQKPIFRYVIYGLVSCVLVLILWPSSVTAAGQALCVGVKSVDKAQYAGWDGVLNAPENDASDMDALLKGCGFASETLLTAAATRENVLAKIDAAAQSLKAGDIFVLYFSGHGGQTPDQNGDEASGWDQTWCLYNGELIDDELYNEWRKFTKGVRILVLSDSCHSGTVIKVNEAMSADDTSLEDIARSFGHNRLSKAMPFSVAVKTYKAHKGFYDNIQATIPKPGSPGIQVTVQLISACKDSEECADGPKNSVFTDAVKHVWDQGAFVGDYPEFADEVKTYAKRRNSSQTSQRMVIDFPDPPYEKQRPFTIKAP